ARLTHFSRNVEKKIIRSDAIRERVIPFNDQLRNISLRRQQCGRRLDRARLQRARLEQLAQRLAENTSKTTIRPVAHRDQSNTVFRQPTHQRPVTRQPTTMSNRMLKPAILRNTEPITITTRAELKWTINGAAKRATRLKTSNLLHLTCTAAFDRTIVGFVTRWVG